jgi:hypothetical protein
MGATVGALQIVELALRMKRLLQVTQMELLELEQIWQFTTVQVGFMVHPPLGFT